MGYVAQDQWDQHYADGRDFRPLRHAERTLLAAYTPPPDSGRALDVGCGTGELAAHLADLGYHVDAVDFASSAVTRATRERADAENIRWLHLDIERDDLAELSGDGYDLITLRLVYAFLKDRARTLRGLAERPRPGGTVVVITPLAEHTPVKRRDIALDEDEIGLLTTGWDEAERLAADGLAVLVLRGPVGDSVTSPQLNGG
ncbi:class I SAM-dependent methyltransferase [Streptomyces sp. NA02950]|uniref:class I SAM-dependent methyltransferase n=1 Tax=Streptomyces sp. NA02950 TaxID=2742137 RepID=UPI0015926B13|nr:class I SAM-dependent methyltransferase [Streptomyces sp. NA02950]QKV96372.1 class I SAM-dependent methyltransferase [Streptomyces sp. NA02950]